MKILCHVKEARLKRTHIDSMIPTTEDSRVKSQTSPRTLMEGRERPKKEQATPDWEVAVS